MIHKQSQIIGMTRDENYGFFYGIVFHSNFYITLSQLQREGKNKNHLFLT